MPLFQPAPVAAQAAAGAAQWPGRLNRQTVVANIGAFGAQPADAAAGLRLRVELPLRAGVLRIAALSPHPSPGTGFETWTGQLEGVALSSATFVVDRESGLVSGTIVSPDGTFEVRPLGGGFHEVAEVDLARLPIEAEPLAAAPLDATALPAAAPNDTADIVDVLVIYTPAARAAAGGTAAIQNAIATAVADTNTSYGNSFIAQRLRLVHQAEVTYTETASSQTDLTRLQSVSDAYLAEAHTLRDQHGADLVALLTTATDVCGIGYLPGTPSATGTAHLGFSLTSLYCLTGGTFSHELGHNMGAHHDRFVVTGASATAYNFGYVSPGGTWRTTMAYGDACGGCARVRYWSNPDVIHPGTDLPMGRAAGGSTPADNHRVLNETALAIANYRSTIGPPPGTVPRSPSGTSTTLTPAYQWDRIAGVTWYQLYVQSTGAPVIETWYTAAAAGCEAATSSTCSITPATALTNGTTYSWWVRTYGPGGNGPWSAAGSFVTNVPLTATPTLTAPTGTIYSNGQTFIWSRSANALWYQFYLSKAGPGTVVADTWYSSSPICSGQVCHLTPNLGFPTGSYNWWVRAWGPDGYSGWSQMAQFTYVAVETPELRGPTGDHASDLPTFSWWLARGATWYRLWVDGPSGTVIDKWFPAFANCYPDPFRGRQDCWGESPVPLAPGPHVWWVQAWSPSGSAWSPPMSFTHTTPEPPPAAVLLAPTGTTTSRTPTYTWSRLRASSWYQIWISGPGGVVMDQWLQAPPLCAPPNTCSFTPTTTLAPGQYVWWIRTWNSGGFGPWSNAANFTVAAGDGRER